MVYNRIKKRLLKRTDFKKKYFKDQLFWSIDQNDEFLSHDILGIKLETYEYISEISNVPIDQLKSKSLGDQTYFLNLQIFNDRLGCFNID